MASITLTISTILAMPNIWRFKIVLFYVSNYWYLNTVTGRRNSQPGQPSNKQIMLVFRLNCFTILVINIFRFCSKYPRFCGCVVTAHLGIGKRSCGDTHIIRIFIYFLPFLFFCFFFCCDLFVCHSINIFAISWIGQFNLIDLLHSSSYPN